MGDAILLAAGPLSSRRGYGQVAPTAPGVVIRERTDEQSVGLAAFRGQLTALAEAVRAQWGIALPTAPRRVEAGRLAFIWMGPERWMVTGPEGEDLEQALRAQLGPFAAITDQSDSRTVLRIQGPRTRDALAKLLPIDLHPRAFQPGDAALTVAAHVNVHLWQLDEAPTYEVAVFRSLADSFHHALCVAAAEYGVDAAA